jgi:hypothetical protein
MTTKIKSLAAATVFALMATSTAFAGEIEVGGNALNVGVVSGAANNISTGFLSKADQAIGVVSGDSNVKIGGNLLNVGVVSGAANNISTGFLSKACQEVGAIGKKC